MSKGSFILHLDSLDVFDELTDSQCRELINAFRDYNSGKDVNLSGLMNAIFISFKNQFDRDDEKYKKISLRNARNGSLGGRPKKNPTEPKKPTGLFDNPTEPKKPYNDNDSDNDSDNDKVYRSFDHLSITSSEFKRLTNEYKPNLVDDILDRIENFKGNKKYKSLYLTAKNWLKKEPQTEQQRPKMRKL